MGPPRALEEAVAEAYVMLLRSRCRCCLWERFNDGNDGNAAPLSVSISTPPEESSPPLEQELSEDDDADRAMADADAPGRIFLPVFILIE